MRALTVVVLLAGCVGGGSEGGGPGEAFSVGEAPPRRSDRAQDLTGTWAYTLETCALTYTFDDSGFYLQEVVCRLPSGIVAREVVTGGEYWVDGSTIEFVPMVSSCPDADAEPFGHIFSLETGDRLRFAALDRGAVRSLFFDRVPGSDGSTSAAGQFGCFDEDGSFIPRDIRPI